MDEEMEFRMVEPFTQDYRANRRKTGICILTPELKILITADFCPRVKITPPCLRHVVHTVAFLLDTCSFSSQTEPLFCLG